MDAIFEFARHPQTDLVCGLLLTAGLMMLAIVHLYWSMGGKMGLGAAIPTEAGEPVLRPTAGATFFIGFASLVSALIMLGTIGLYPDAEPAVLYSIWPWIMFVVFLLRTIGDFRYMGFFKRMLGTRFSRLDSVFYTPFSLVMAFSALLLAV